MLESWIARMHGHRRRAVLDLAEILIRIGKRTEAEDLLRQRLMERPEDETAYMLPMRALYLAGDGSTALAVYQQAYRRLATSGLRLGPQLRAAHYAILNHQQFADQVGISRLIRPWPPIPVGA
ncbi:AfsR/SARP family transcriptional regulator [Nonomuraea turcica]|uniref:AfsR/SARP family transcriptional regulator n=1 Tax=Nonomuraea sp. G32 TaxID=3067274 RepID=UPI00273B9C96|nr:BTAD domain-containing putative transcriptional regulator [Nonomuraea sp. G32]MDP4511022.1 tetratricopeptide repeat protein [Nonomuraea sp. G32]